MIPVVVAIGGSDSSGGAGIQADLRALRDQRVAARTVITAVTAQTDDAVTAVHPVPIAIVEAQLAAAFAGPVGAVKIGMLGEAEIGETVLRFLGRRDPRPPIVLDPVLAASSGGSLASAHLAPVLHELARIATLSTPNASEATRLGPLPGAVLVTGGDVPGPDVVDVLLGHREWRFPRIEGHFRGTGCTLSSAVAAGLAKGLRLEDAIEAAILYVRSRMASGWR